jgi:ATP adenylyltransferase
MERLFSPWRSQYIASFSAKDKDERCLFCRVMKERNDRKNLVVARYDHCFVMQNLYPYNNGHLMIVPYTHTAQMTGLSKQEYAAVLDVTAKMIEALKLAMQPHGFNFGANLGRVAGAGIDEHIHFHLVPRWNGDTNFMPTLADVKLVSESMEVTHQKLKRAIRKLKSQ